MISNPLDRQVRGFLGTRNTNKHTCILINTSITKELRYIIIKCCITEKFHRNHRYSKVVIENRLTNPSTGVSPFHTWMETKIHQQTSTKNFTIYILTK